MLENQAQNLQVAQSYELERLLSIKEPGLQELSEIVTTLEGYGEEISINNEGLIERTFIMMVDTLISFVNRLRRSAVSFITRDYSYSDLQVYTQNNRILVSKILKLPYSQIMDLMVQNPPLTIPPERAIKKLKNMHTALNLVEISQSYIPVTESFLSFLYIESYNDIKKLLNASIPLSTLGEEVTKELTKLTNISVKKLPFGKIFDSVDSLKSYYSETIAMSNVYKELNTLEKNEGLINKRINNATEKIKQLVIQDKKNFARSLTNFSKIIYNLATYYEGYGNVLKAYSFIGAHNIEMFKVLKIKV